MIRIIRTFALLAFIVGCAGSLTMASIINDAQTLIGTPVVSAVCPAGPCGLTGAYLTFEKLYPQAVSPVADAKIQTLLATATETGGLLDRLKAASTAAEQAKGIRDVENVANQVLGIIATEIAQVPGIDPTVVLGFQGAEILIPILEAAANQLVPVGARAALRMPAAFANPSMTADQARAALRR